VNNTCVDTTSLNSAAWQNTTSDFSWSAQRSWETWWRQLTQPLHSVSIFVLMCQTKWFSALLKLVNSRK